MTHEQIIKSLTEATKSVPGIQALFLSGSYAIGRADAWSDIDFILVADDGATDDVAAVWRDAVARTGEIVLWWDRTTVPVLINAITADWTRTDVIILKPEQMNAHVQTALKPLFDHRNLYADLRPSAPAQAPDPKKILYQFEEFIRVLGLLHLVDGRGEYINGVLGVFHLRNLLVELLILETNAPDRGGVLHLNRLITKEQQALILSLPPIASTRAAMIDAHLAYAKAYLPRARGYAQQHGIVWPERFETVTWEKLHATTGIDRPYDPQDLNRP